MQFRLNRIDEINNFFIENIEEREIMGKRIKKILSILNYVYWSLLGITRASVTVSIFSFATIIGSPLGLFSETIKLKACLSSAIIRNTINHKKRQRKKQ